MWRCRRLQEMPALLADLLLLCSPTVATCVPGHGVQVLTVRLATFRRSCCSLLRRCHPSALAQRLQTCLQQLTSPARCILRLLLQNSRFKGFCDMIRANSEEFEAQGRVLRLKQFIRADAKQAQIDAILDALEDNTRVEALYIQNFEMVSIALPALVLKEAGGSTCCCAALGAIDGPCSSRMLR